MKIDWWSKPRTSNSHLSNFNAWKDWWRVVNDWWVVRGERNDNYVPDFVSSPGSRTWTSAFASSPAYRSRPGISSQPRAIIDRDGRTVTEKQRIISGPSKITCISSCRHGTRYIRTAKLSLSIRIFIRCIGVLRYSGELIFGFSNSYVVSRFNKNSLYQGSNVVCRRSNKLPFFWDWVEGPSKRTARPCASPCRMAEEFPQTLSGDRVRPYRAPVCVEAFLQYNHNKHSFTPYTLRANSGIGKLPPPHMISFFFFYDFFTIYFFFI